MARFLLRTILSSIVTMLLVSIALFLLLEVGSGDVTIKILGIESTQAQRESYRQQLGLDQPVWLRYSTWLLGNDWWVQNRLDHPLAKAENPQTGEAEWWQDVDGTLTRFRLNEGELVALERQADGNTLARSAEELWSMTESEVGEPIDEFWGVNVDNRAVRWVRGDGATVMVRTFAGFREESDGPVDYIPLASGLLRGDPGQSLRTGRPVAVSLFPRVRNTAILAGLAFLFIMPLALLFGIIAGVTEGRLSDRVISVSSLALTATPEFVTGIVLILIFAIWLQWLPAASFLMKDASEFLTFRDLFTRPDVFWQDFRILILPILTLTAVELGYIIRMTRASMVDVMNSPYIRTAIIKGMPYRRIVLRHAVRNALLAPITVIMLHVNWLIGGIVVVEAVFGYPGLGTYVFESAIFGDFNAIEAAAMITVVIAVATRIIGDVAYMYLNPRIRYA